MNETISNLRNQALKLFQKGQFGEAAQLQEKVVEQNSSTLLDAKRLALFTINNGNYEHGLETLNKAETKFPTHNDVEIFDTQALCLMRLKRFDEAIRPFEQALEIEPDKINSHDGLAELYGKIEDWPKSRFHGEQSLRLKDRESKANPLLDLKTIDVPAFNPQTPKKNIISFCLWGTNPLYLHGAIFNAQAAKSLYPEWTCRFYMDDSVPEGVKTQLIKMGAEIVMKERPQKPFLGLFWRFLVCNDPEVDRYMIRDADSLISPREKACVEQWIKSEKHFHVMRDFFTHTELILAGLWGGVTNALPPLSPLINDFMNKTQPNRTVDQQFTRSLIWPTLKTSALIHDSHHDLENTSPFPDNAPHPKGTHTGQRFDVYFKLTQPQKK